MLPWLISCSVVTMFICSLNQLSVILQPCCLPCWWNFSVQHPSHCLSMPLSAVSQTDTPELQSLKEYFGSISHFRSYFFHPFSFIQKLKKMNFDSKKERHLSFQLNVQMFLFSKADVQDDETNRIWFMSFLRNHIISFHNFHFIISKQKCLKLAWQ